MTTTEDKDKEFVKTKCQNIDNQITTTTDLMEHLKTSDTETKQLKVGG